MLLALGLILPLVTGNIPRVGNMLLPMHLPVFLGGLLLGWQYGLILGAVLPLMRSLLFGMPPLYPVALAMTFELATYGAVAGALYRRSPWSACGHCTAPCFSRCSRGAQSGELRKLRCSAWRGRPLPGRCSSQGRS